MIFTLRGTVQPYEWGGRTRLSGLLQLPEQTLAEWWIGAHPKAPALLEDGETLDSWITRHGAAALGELASNRYGQLPFLLKILDVQRPLSIQIHPTPQQAREGFAREEAAGIPIGDPRRNFRDPNPKPELAVALEPTWMLFGFREYEAAVADLDRLGLGDLCNSAASCADLLEWWLTQPSAFREIHLQKLYKAAAQETEATPDQAEYWINDWMYHNADHRRHDPGVLGFVLFNIISLPVHAGVFLEATVPHAYLRGALVEVMANSDNVLRCGLTTKTIDVDQMMACVQRRPQAPELLNGDGERTIYQPPVGEFGLERLAGSTSRAYQSGSAEIWMCVSGLVRLTAFDGQPVCLTQGQCAFVSANTHYTADLESTHCYRAFVPDGNHCADR